MGRKVFGRFFFYPCDVTGRVCGRQASYLCPRREFSCSHVPDGFVEALVVVVCQGCLTGRRQ